MTLQRKISINIFLAILAMAFICAGIYFFRYEHVSEAEYYEYSASRCVVNQVSLLLQGYLEKEKRLPGDREELELFLIKNKQKIKCGPNLEISSSGRLVDAQGDRLVYVNEGHSALVYSTNVPSRDFSDKSFYYGLRVLPDKVVETRVARK